jgi:Tfp pilus assembly protein PilV
MTWGGFRSRAGREAGFALIETLASAALLVAVALAALSGIDRVQRSSLAGKARSVAATLAEQDQERMRAMKAIDLSNYRPAARTVTSGGVDYTVTSRGDWVTDANGGTQSCSNSSTQADYIEITSTVSAPAADAEIRPVSVQSLVAPPVGAFGPNQGTLAVHVTDRDGTDVVGMPVSATGPVNRSDTTNSAGCAVFAYVPVGNYHVLLNQPGWVDPVGSTSVDMTQTVSAGNVNVKDVSYDRAATISVKFDTRPAGAPAPIDSRGWGATAVTSAVSHLWQFVATAPPQANVDVTNVYPHVGSFRLYSGVCTSADPVAAIPDPNYFTTNPADAVAVDPGQTYTVTVRQPALNLTVKRAGVPVSNASVVLTATNGDCAGTKYVLTTDVTGRATKPALAPAFIFDPGVPFGTYDVCVASAARRRTQTGVAVTDPTNGSAAVAVDMSGAGGGTCTTTGPAFP